MRRSTPTSRSPSTPPRSASGSLPASGAAASSRGATIGIPADAPVEAPPGTIARGRAGRCRRAAGRTRRKFSSGEVLDRRRVARADRRRLHVRRWRRSAPAPATRPSAVPAELEPIFEVKLTEVMSRRAGERRRAPRRRRRGEGDRGGASARPASCSARGSGRAERSARPRPRARPRIEAPLVIDADGLNALGTDLGALAAREQPTVLTPHAGELGAAARLRAPRRSAPPPRERPRGAAEASGAVVVLKGDDTIVVDGRDEDSPSTSSPARRWRRPGRATCSAA